MVVAVVLTVRVEVTAPVPDQDGGQVITAYLATQLDAITAEDPAVRTDVPDAVHKMRVATRRFRSTLRVFAPFLDLMVWSVILAVTLYPLQMKLQRSFPRKDASAADKQLVFEALQYRMGRKPIDYQRYGPGDSWSIEDLRRK